MMTYNNFALIYDQLMNEAPYDEWVNFTLHFLKQRQANKIVDLGCGTGEITLRLAKRYENIVGVDRSAEMLAIAEQKTNVSNNSILWVKQDIRYLTGFNEVDLFISYCDVINYITDKADLLMLFQKIYDSLSSEGLFIFDIHSIAHVN